MAPLAEMAEEAIYPMNEPIILFGSGTIGRFVARWLKEKGNPPACFADNSPKKWNTDTEGIPILSPGDALDQFPNAIWVATVLHTPYPAEIGKQLKDMGVKVEPLENYLSINRAPLRMGICSEIVYLCADAASIEEMWDQFHFRMHGKNHAQAPPSDISKLYFEDFIKPIAKEHFVDCGAADGDSIRAFMAWQPNFSSITAFEPDPKNREALRHRICDPLVAIHPAAVSDHCGTAKILCYGRSDFSPRLFGRD